MARHKLLLIIERGSLFVCRYKKRKRYDASLAPKTQDGNVKGVSCYHWGNYETLRERDKELLTQGQKKKLLEVRETRNYS
jgi:hypothetical protein